MEFPSRLWYTSSNQPVREFLVLEGSASLIDFITAAAVLVEIAWALKLWRTGLYRRYPVLFTFLVAALLGTVGLYIVYYFYAASVVYGWWWVVFQPLTWTLYFCLLVEAHNRMLSGFEGFERLGQLLIYAASGTVGAVFLGMIFLETSRETWAQFWFLQERNVYVGLTVFALFLVGFGSYFRLAIPRNVKTLFAAFAMFFGAFSIILILAKMVVEPTEAVKKLLMAATYLLCIGFGAARFSRAGDEQPQSIRLQEPLNHEAEAELTSGLESLNNVLLRILRS